MASLVPYINFGHNSRKAIAFYKAIFGGTAEVQEFEGRIVQLAFTAGDLHFMGSDHESSDAGLSSGANLVLNCDSEAQLHAFYSKLIISGQAVFAPVDSGWGAIVAHCVDQFGVTWMLNYDLPQA